MLTEKEYYDIRIFRIIKQIFVVAMSFLSCNALECVSMNNQECRIRPEIININSNKPLFYPYSVKIGKYSGSCKNINTHMQNYVFLMLLKT